VIRETVVLAALAISSPAVIDGDTVRIAGRVDPFNRLQLARAVLAQMPA